ncbi:SPFH domain-containing protein [Streptomyces sp. NPDC004059]
MEVAGLLPGADGRKSVGLLGLGAAATLLAAASAVSASGAKAGLIVAGLVVFHAAVISLRGLNTVAPDEARVVQLFGRYRGTIRNHETAVLKVNDAYGNPIELAAVVVWEVQDTAQAVFEMDDYAEFVATQTETAVRHIAIEYPYDAHDEEGLSLRGNAEEIAEKLAVELQARVESAGVREQAGAVVAARRRIVDGAFGMVEAALGPIAEAGIVELDEERKGAMVSTLMVVQYRDRAPQSVLGAGALYR